MLPISCKLDVGLRDLIRVRSNVLTRSILGEAINFLWYWIRRPRRPEGPSPLSFAAANAGDGLGSMMKSAPAHLVNTLKPCASLSLHHLLTWGFLKLITFFFCLCWIVTACVSVCVAGVGGAFSTFYSSLQWAGFSLQWFLLARGTDSKVHGLQ